MDDHRYYQVGSRPTMMAELRWYRHLDAIPDEFIPAFELSFESSFSDAKPDRIRIAIRLQSIWQCEAGNQCSPSYRGGPGERAFFCLNVQNA